jgi:hypothetical protein
MASKKPSIELTKKFIKGLETYGLSYEEIKNSNWKYCGGNEGRHLNYYRICYVDKELLEHTDKCVCGHHIEENCYITDGSRFLILGNCCIRKFIEKSSRTCEMCERPHKNRKVNFCNDCRKIQEEINLMKKIKKEQEDRLIEIKNNYNECPKCNRFVVEKKGSWNNKLCIPCLKSVNKTKTEKQCSCGDMMESWMSLCKKCYRK